MSLLAVLALILAVAGIIWDGRLVGVAVVLLAILHLL